MGLFSKKKNTCDAGTEELAVWPRATSEIHRNLIWRVPDKTPNSKYFSMKKIKEFGVRGSENALFFVDGALIDTLTGGTYALDKSARNEATEIVWIDMGIIRIPWGISKNKGLRTKEGHQLGLSGEMKLQVNDPKSFGINVVSRLKRFTNLELQDWILTILTSVFREITPSYEAYDLQLAQRDEIITNTRVRVIDEFSTYGLSLVSLDISNYVFPPEVEQILESKSKFAQLDAEDVMAQKNAEIEAKRIQREQALEKIRHEAKLKGITQETELQRLSKMSDLQLNSDLETFGTKSEIELEKIKAEGSAEKELILAKAEGITTLLKNKPLLIIEELQREISRKDDLDRLNAASLAKNLTKIVESDSEVKQIFANNAPSAMNALARIKLAEKPGSKWLEGTSHEEVLNNLNQLSNIIKNLNQTRIEHTGVVITGESRVQLEQRLKELRQKLDKIDNSLLRKEISEETHKQMTRRIEEEIDEIKKKI